ncbi:MAG: hypothetical protein L6R37_000527 [Teloschistes peruensis]|nr:MAG: hypothetical protein L6R37_000527 [Teloschistes peruensis]
MAPPEPITPVRKSGRMRQPNKKYSADTFADLDILSSASEEEVEARIPFEISDHDEDFDETKAVEEEAIDEAKDDILSAEAMSDGSGIATPMEESDDCMSADGDQPADRGLSSTARRRSHPKLSRHTGEVGTHMRGITDPSGAKVRGGPKSDYLYALFGDATQDVIHMARSRDQWCDAVTLPERPNESGSRGMHHFFSHPEEKCHWEATVGWDWYYIHGGRRYFEAMQRSHSLSSKEANRYVPQPSHSYRTVFMGPYGRQTRFDLPILQSMALREAWEQASQPNKDEAPGPARHKRKPPREGWLLNVGTGVRCLDWAPNHSGDTQYLALSTFQPRINEPLKFSPAFTPQSFPSSIQIWSFCSSEAPDRKSLLDPITPPRLRLVICFDWGDAKHLTWCPMPRKFRDEGQEECKIPIGLLAGVWSDGHVRVIDIHLDASQSLQETRYSSIRPPPPIG